MVVVVESVHGSSRGRTRLGVVAVVVKQVGAGLSSKCQVHHLDGAAAVAAAALERGQRLP